ncbi:lytic transglycosylase domain-containing protein [Actinokineospora alba]|nr:lytic transglycosylase domain-containing protein [Actinokineospora alba]
MGKRRARCHEFDEALKRAEAMTRHSAVLMTAFMIISVATASNASGSNGTDLGVTARPGPGLSDDLAPRVEDRIVVLIPPWREARGDVIAVADVTPESESGREAISGAGGSRLASGQLPPVAFSAYLRAESSLAVQRPSCGIEWSLIAAIGRVESNHGQYGGARLRPDGTTTRPIRGVPLDGTPGVAYIADTDRGALDGDTMFDRAVGPMQFIPGTWRAVFPTGNPDNIFDAALAAGRYLCAGGGNLRIGEERARAVFRYNHSREYVNLVLRLAEFYRSGSVDLVDQPPPSAAPEARPALALPPPSPVRPDAASARISTTSTRVGSPSTATTTPPAGPRTTVAPVTPSPAPTSCPPAGDDAPATCGTEPGPTASTSSPSAEPQPREPPLICTILGLIVEC